MAVRAPVDLASWLDTGPVPGFVGDADGACPEDAPPGVGPTLLIGPEGGLTDDELARLDLDGWIRVRLAPHVLRSETAAVAGLAILSASRFGYTPAP
jgi:16S rRNA (uracil1498-N3)-methyltransferase